MLISSPRLRQLFGWLGKRPAVAPVEATREPRPPAVERLATLCGEILAGFGEAAGLAAAKQILQDYAGLPAAEKRAFFECLAEDFGPDWNAARKAWHAHEQAPSRDRFRRLLQRLEPPRQEIFRRLNRVPGATSALVSMRSELLDLAANDPDLLSVDDDFVHLFQSWFNRGFLVMRRIDWSTPAAILERIIRYEAVHRISDWQDLRRRLEPPDRRCYAFFHPAIADDPLIFVEVAMGREVPRAIADVLSEQRPICPPDEARVAVFYSISNCHRGLRGISFGNFLIKQVVEDLSLAHPQLETFATLSPTPGFRRWLRSVSPEIAGHPGNRALLDRLENDDWTNDPGTCEALRKLLEPYAAHYFLKEKDAVGRPLDPVARFHLANGARLDQLCWAADKSERAMRESAGLMVNYRYDPAEIEANRERFARDGGVVASETVTQLLGASRIRNERARLSA